MDVRIKKMERKWGCDKREREGEGEPMAQQIITLTVTFALTFSEKGVKERGRGR
jgi:hypothetical protein